MSNTAPHTDISMIQGLVQVLYVLRATDWPYVWGRKITINSLKGRPIWVHPSLTVKRDYEQETNSSNIVINLEPKRIEQHGTFRN